MTNATATAAKVWTKDEIRAMLLNNPVALERGIVRIFELQTQDEQETESTGELNGVGFNGTDAFILSNFAKQILSPSSRYAAGSRLSVKQRAIALKKMPKYAGQLARIANEAAEYAHEQQFICPKCDGGKGAMDSECINCESEG